MKFLVSLLVLAASLNAAAPVIQSLQIQKATPFLVQQNVGIGSGKTLTFLTGSFLTVNSGTTVSGLATSTQLNGKQDTLVSGTNIKTINGTTLLGSGDLSLLGTTNLTLALTATTVSVSSDTGTDVIIPAATGTNAGAMTAADRTKLDGIAAGATVNSSDAFLLGRANHTGSQAQSTITNLVTDLGNKQPLATVLTNTTAAFTTAQETKLSGIATGATANSSDAFLLDRTNHTGSQAQSTITNLTTDLGLKAVSSALIAVNASGINVAGLVHWTQLMGVPSGFADGTDDGGGGGGATNISYSQTSTTLTVISDSGTDAILPAASTTLAGMFSAADKTKLDGVAANATVNSSDAFLLARANHTGSQAQSTITNLVTDLGNKQPLATVLTNTTAAFTTAQETKLSGIATGATANSSDAFLLGRANHTGSQAQSTITNLVTDLGLKAISADILANNASGVNTDGLLHWSQLMGVPAGFADGTDDGAGGGATNLTFSRTSTTVTVLSDTGTDAILPAATTTDAGVLTAADKTKLDGVATGATANSSDATLLNRANHTGSQAQSTVTDLVSDLALKAPITNPQILHTNNTITTAINVTRLKNIVTLSGPTIFTNSAAPTTGSAYGAVVTGGAAAYTVTLPQSTYSHSHKSNITSYSHPASMRAHLIFEYDGTTYEVYGVPTSNADLAIVTPLNTHYVAGHDGTGDARFLVSSLMALAGGASDPTLNAQTGTAYTFLLTDNNNMVTMTNAAANVATIPTNATAAFPTGAIIAVSQQGAGATTITPITGVTLNGATSSITLSAQYQWASLIKTGTNAWSISYSAAGGGGGGDASTNTASSVANEVAVFAGTTGKLLARATGTGIAKLTSGVLGTAVSATDYAPATTGTSILKASSGGFANAVASTDYLAPKTVNNQTGIAYTFVLTDAYNIVTSTNAATNTLTIPTNATTAFGIGTEIDVQQGGAGITTIAPDTGVTLNGGTSSLSISTINRWATITKIGTNAWALAYSQVGSSDASTNTTASVEGEITVFSGTSGKLLQRATGTGIVKITSGVLSTTTAGTDYAPATSGSGILKGNGAGGFSTASPNTDYALTPTVNAQTGTTYTLVSGDRYNIVTMSNAAANAVLIPTNAALAFATGTVIAIQMKGVGVTSIDPDTGVTLNGGTATIPLSAQYQWASLVKTGTDEWQMSYSAAGGTGDALVANNLDQFAGVTQTAGQTLAITASTTLSGGTHSGTNTGDQTSVTGNAGTATALQTARTIGGVSFDGTANINIPGRLLSTQVILNGTTTYTTPANVTKIRVIAIAGGGGGGGVSGAASSVGAGGGGGSGSYVEKLFTVTASTGYTVAVGGGGTAGANTGGTGGTGGNTTMTVGATTITANGGLGGVGQVTGTALGVVVGGAGGAVSTNGDVNLAGTGGGGGVRLSGTVGLSGTGAGGLYGQGGGVGLTVANPGNNAGNYGAGGGGGLSTANTARVGGTGSNGVIIVYEFSN